MLNLENKKNGIEKIFGNGKVVTEKSKVLNAGISCKNANSQDICRRLN